MRVLLFYDLPTITKADVANYNVFHKNILKLGFYMLQFSIYVRITDNHPDANRMVKLVRNILPPDGQIRALIITDHQYQKMLVLLGDAMAWEKDYDEIDKTVVI